MMVCWMGSRSRRHFNAMSLMPTVILPGQASYPQNNHRLVPMTDFRRRAVVA
jgi:hypothetical protein